MKKIFVLICLLSFGTSVKGQDIPVVKFNAVEGILQSKDYEIVIINFWATWCAPCVAELPIFDKYFVEKPAGTAMYLVNLDFVEKLGRVKSFVKRKNLKPPVLLLDEIDYNSWIDKVDSSWGGAIPATLVINTITGKRKFVGKELTETDLQDIIADVKN
jgi:thiol-disulfide isomerase/thioredoxin